MSIRQFEKKLSPEGLAYLQETRTCLKGLRTTKDLYCKGGVYSRARVRDVHQVVVRKLLGKSVVRVKQGQPWMLIVLGPPGSGKNTALHKICPRILRTAIVADNDQVKSLMPGFKRHKAAAFHEESSDILVQLMAGCLINKRDLIWLAVGKTEKNIRNVIRSARREGYWVGIILINLTPMEAARRAWKRFIDGGRFVDPKYVLMEVGLKPRGTYVTLKKEADYYAHYDNQVPLGRAPRLVKESSAVARPQ